MYICTRCKQMAGVDREERKRVKKGEEGEGVGRVREGKGRLGLLHMILWCAGLRED